MIEWLVKIPGPTFLTYFSILSLICIGGSWLLVRTSEEDYPLPDKNKLEPITVAALQGQWKAVIDVVLIQLIERDIVSISKQSGQDILSIKNKDVDLSPVEEVVYKYLTVPKKQSEFTQSEMRIPMEYALQATYRDMKKKHLWKTDEEVSRRKNTTYFMLFCLYVLALTKMYFAMIYHKPIIFLLVVLVLTTFIIVKIMRPNHRVTLLGEQYIKEVKEHFSWIKADLGNQRGGRSSSLTYALGVAIFGVGILVSSEIFDGYEAFIQPKRNGYDSLGADSSSGGSDGGSSDGGSGCGGCGGCGGGD